MGNGQLSETAGCDSGCSPRRSRREPRHAQAGGAWKGGSGLQAGARQTSGHPTWSPRASSYLHLGQVPITKLRACAKAEAAGDCQRARIDGSHEGMHSDVNMHTTCPGRVLPGSQQGLRRDRARSAGHAWGWSVCARGRRRRAGAPAPLSSSSPVSQELPQGLAVQLLNRLLHQAAPLLQGAEDVLRGGGGGGRDGCWEPCAARGTAPLVGPTLDPRT